MDDEYYEDSYWSASHIKSMVNHQKNQADSFVKEYELENKKVIDIGCGDGNYLEYIQASGAISYGVGPAKSTAAIAIDKMGLDKIHVGYETRDELIPGSPYDAFVSRQVLERTPDLNDFCKALVCH